MVLLDGLRREADRRLFPARMAGFFALDFTQEYLDWVIIAVHHPFLERDDGVVGDVDVFGAHFRTAFRDVAQTESRLVFEQWKAVQ